MAFIQSEGALESLGKRTDPIPPYGLMLTNDVFATYGAIWRAQPAVRTVVGYLARNIAQLGIHVFDRVDDNNRIRLKDHPLARLLDRPLPAEYKVTRYKLISDMMHDIGIFDQSLWIKMRTDDTIGGLVRVPPYRVYPKGDNWMRPDYFEIRGNSGKRELGPDEVVFIRGYNPDDSREGTPSIEALRQILAEDYESAVYREQMWQSGSRLSGYIQRPVEAPRWNPGARTRFRDEWDAQYRGAAAANARTPILEDGMEYVAAGITPKDAQYVESRKLTREEVASAYFIPPSMVGAADAPFASLREQHQMLYQDALGPWLKSIKEEIELQLLPDFESYPTTIYVEFNIEEKLKGSFEDQASSMSTMVGRPIMTANEGRARLNLPELDEGDGLVVPLNVMIGGQPNPQNPLEEPNATEPNPAAEAPSATDLAGEPQAASRGVRVKALVSQDATDGLEGALAKYFARQEQVVVSKLGGKAGPSWWSADRWDSELAADLFPLFLAMGTEAGRLAMKEIGEDPDDYDEDRTMAWMAAHAEGVAKAINITTQDEILNALKGDNPLAAVKTLFGWYKKSRAKKLAQTSATDLSGFGTQEAVKQKEKEGTKTWITGTNPRSKHKALNGETVDLYKPFSNGARWPGDGRLPIAQRANCNCDMEVRIKEGKN